MNRVWDVGNTCSTVLVSVTQYAPGLIICENLASFRSRPSRQMSRRFTTPDPSRQELAKRLADWRYGQETVGIGGTEHVEASLTLVDVRFYR